MSTKLIALLITIVAVALPSFAQTGGMQVVMLDGSVRNLLEVETEFPLLTDPGEVRVRIAKLPATTLEECMASTDFSSAKRMDPRMYRAVYNQATGTEHFNFGVEREMKNTGGDPSRSQSSCHVVRFAASSVDGRDFLIWQRNPSLSSSTLAEWIFNSDAAPVLQDGSVRFIKHSVSNGF